jgi:hypothetical protein
VISDPLGMLSGTSMDVVDLLAQAYPPKTRTIITGSIKDRLIVIYTLNIQKLGMLLSLITMKGSMVIELKRG